MANLGRLSELQLSDKLAPVSGQVSWLIFLCLETIAMYQCFRSRIFTRLAGLIVVIIVGSSALALAQQTSTFAPPNIVRAIYLQTTGRLARYAQVEPCTTAGLSDAVRRSEDAYDNQDIQTLVTEQGGFAVGFAHCALNATNASDFAVFAGATVQSGVAVIDAEKARDDFSAMQRAHAQQMYLISKWLLNDPGADETTKGIAKDSIKKLRSIHAI